MNIPRPRTGLVLPGVTVALTPARAATSRLRQRYHERYRGRYRFPGLLFGIDLLVVTAIIAIFGVGIWLSQSQPQTTSGLQLVFSAPPIMTATTIAFDAQISVQDGRAHPSVRLDWILPAGAKIVSSSPSVDAQTEAELGDLYPGEVRHARLAVQIFSPPGSIRIGFQVHSGEELLSGEEIRPIIGSALHLQPVLDHVRSSASREIFSLQNLGNASLDCAQVQTSGNITDRFDAQSIYHYAYPGGSMAVFDTINPGEERFIPIDGPADVRLTCNGVELERLANVANEPTHWTPPLSAYLASSTPGQDTILTVTSTEPLRVLIYHPLMKDADYGRRWFEVASGTTQITLPLDIGKKITRLSDRTPRWMVWLTRSAPDGVELLQSYDAPITTPFIVQAEARYYAVSGGQIGAGPLPPRVGEATRYWIQWKIAPTVTDLSQLELRARLPNGVSFTGQKALPNGGTLEQEDDQLVWRLPFLSANSADTASAFEVSLTPTSEMRDTTPLLLDITQVQAIENRSSTTLNAKINAVDTGLQTDEKGKGQGWVR